MLREVRIQPDLEARIARFKARYPRFEQPLNAALLAISRNAESLPVVPETTLRVVVTRFVPGMAAFAFYFAIDSDSVCTLLDIRETDE
jgi:hypothetical protein